MAEGTLKEELSDWLDKLAIQELIVRYSDIATRGLWEEFERLWTADAVWETAPPINDRTVGANAIRAQVAKNLAGEEFLVQTTHGSVVTLHGGDRASATTTIHAIARRGEDHAVTNYGIYFDELARTEDGWKFARRRLQPIYVEPDTLPGTATISRQELETLR